MATTSSVCGALALGLALRVCTPVAVDLLPPGLTHTMDASSCHWRAKPWAHRLGGSDAPSYTPAGERAYADCLRSHGLKSRLPVLNTVLAKWPSQAELAALSRQDTEDENPLPAQGPRLAGDVRSDHPGRG